MKKEGTFNGLTLGTLNKDMRTKVNLLLKASEAFAVSHGHQHAPIFVIPVDKNEVSTGNAEKVAAL